MFGRLLALFRQAENTLGTDAIPSAADRTPIGCVCTICAPHTCIPTLPHACRVTAIYQVVFVNDEYFAPWSAADYFCEFTYLAIGRYYHGTMPTSLMCTGHCWWPCSLPRKHRPQTPPHHTLAAYITKALWGWPVGRNTASQDAHERRMCSRGASGTYGAKMPGSGDLMESEYRIGVPVLRYKARAFCMRVRAEPQCELCVCYENFG